jgi:hypothetical protein
MAETHIEAQAEGVDRPTGPAAAAMLAAGIGSLTLGIVTTLAEASTGFHDWLEWDKDVGPLSGKTIIAVIVFFAAWAVLGVLWRKRDVPLRTVSLVTLVLVALGLLGTFPTFFQAFAPEE